MFWVFICLYLFVWMLIWLINTTVDCFDFIGVVWCLLFWDLWCCCLCFVSWLWLMCVGNLDCICYLVCASTMVCVYEFLLNVGVCLVYFGIYSFGFGFGLASLLLNFVVAEYINCYYFVVLCFVWRFFVLFFVLMLVTDDWFWIFNCCFGGLLRCLIYWRLLDCICCLLCVN